MLRRSTNNTTRQVVAFLRHGHPRLAFGVLLVRYVAAPAVIVIAGAMMRLWLQS